MEDHYYVSLSLEACIDRVHAAVTGSITGELIDRYEVPHPKGGTCVVLDDFAGTDVTQVHCAGGGGGEGLFRFDWGAAGSFEDAVHRALEAYRL